MGMFSRERPVDNFAESADIGFTVTPKRLEFTCNSHVSGQNLRCQRPWTDGPPSLHQPGRWIVVKQKHAVIERTRPRVAWASGQWQVRAAANLGRCLRPLRACGRPEYDVACSRVTVGASSRPTAASNRRH